MRLPHFQPAPRAPHPSYGQLYVDYVQQNLFMPIGLPLFNKGELNSYMGWFSNGVSVGLIANSQFGPNQDLEAAVRAAMREVASAR
jgi:hypothetical protein